VVAGSGPPPNSCFALRASQDFDFSEHRSRPDTIIRGLLATSAPGQRMRRWCGDGRHRRIKSTWGGAFSAPGEPAAAFADGLAYPGSPSTSIRSTLSG